MDGRRVRAVQSQASRHGVQQSPQVQRNVLHQRVLRQKLPRTVGRVIVMVLQHHVLPHHHVLHYTHLIRYNLVVHLSHQLHLAQVIHGNHLANQVRVQVIQGNHLANHHLSHLVNHHHSRVNLQVSLRFQVASLLGIHHRLLGLHLIQVRAQVIQGSHLANLHHSQAQYPVKSRCYCHRDKRSNPNPNRFLLAPCSAPRSAGRVVRRLMLVANGPKMVAPPNQRKAHPNHSLGRQNHVRPKVKIVWLMVP